MFLDGAVREIKKGLSNQHCLILFHEDLISLGGVSEGGRRGRPSTRHWRRSIHGVARFHLNWHRRGGRGRGDGLAVLFMHHQGFESLKYFTIATTDPSSETAKFALPRVVGIDVLQITLDVGTCFFYTSMIRTVCPGLILFTMQ